MKSNQIERQWSEERGDNSNDNDNDDDNDVDNNDDNKQEKKDEIDTISAYKKKRRDREARQTEHSHE